MFDAVIRINFLSGRGNSSLYDYNTILTHFCNTSYFDFNSKVQAPL